MADRLSDGRIKKIAVADGKDRFEDLPKDVLQLLLSFLTSRDAVRTSVLARRWRNLWKSLPSLRLYTYDLEVGEEYESVHAYNNFVNMLLEFRDRTAPLDVGVIQPYPRGDESEAYRDVESWVQYAVSCKVSLLRIQNPRSYVGYLQLSSRTVISKHLTVLELHNLAFEDPLDLVNCQALEVLEFDDCIINDGVIFPKSLQHLKIIRSALSSTHTPRARISAPGLVTLELADCWEWTPLLESLPSLVTALIRINTDSEDYCWRKHPEDCGYESCDECSVEDDCSVLLEGLSGATNLELISKPTMIFRRDLKLCPMFGNLKTVLLNEWCVAANFNGLVYFLQHSPILERLTLQVNMHPETETGEIYHPKEYFLVSKHLNVVEIYCYKQEEEMVCPILKILCTHGVNPAQINIKHNSRLQFRSEELDQMFNYSWLFRLFMSNLGTARLIVFCVPVSCVCPCSIHMKYELLSRCCSMVRCQCSHVALLLVS